MLRQLFCALSATAIVLVPAVANAGAILGSIMPLGDSITYGEGVPGGYENQLYLDLAGAGDSFTFVGSVDNNATSTLINAGDQYTEGHPGYRVDQIASNLFADNDDSGGGDWLSGGGVSGRNPVYPNYVLLMAGINDMEQNYDPAYPSGNAPLATFMTDLESRYTSLVDELVVQRPTMQLIISSVLPVVSGTDPTGGPVTTQEVVPFNAWLSNTLVPQFQAAGDAVTYVDTYDDFVNGQNDDVVVDDFQSDGLHPSQGGYDTLGDSFASAIDALVPEPGSFGLFSAAGSITLLRWRGRRITKYR